MPYFILGIAVLIGLFLVIRGLRKTNPKNAQKVLVILVGLVLAVIVTYLVISGRIGPLGWLLFLLPMVWRWRAIKQMLGNIRGPTPGKYSDIETAYLRMNLEHDTGVLRGTVLKGPFEGRLLEEMPVNDIIQLLHECRIKTRSQPRSWKRTSIVYMAPGGGTLPAHIPMIIPRSAMTGQ